MLFAALPCLFAFNPLPFLSKSFTTLIFKIPFHILAYAFILAFFFIILPLSFLFICSVLIIGQYCLLKVLRTLTLVDTLWLFQITSTPLCALHHHSSDALMKHHTCTWTVHLHCGCAPSMHIRQSVRQYPSMFVNVVMLHFFLLIQRGKAQGRDRRQSIWFTPLCFVSMAP